MSYMKRDEHVTEYNAKEVNLCIRHQRGALGYNQERLAELSEISNSFLSDIEHDDQGFSVALLGRLSRVLGLSTDYILFGTEQATDISDVIGMLSGLDRKYTPKLKEPLGVYLKATTLAEEQNH